MKGHQSFYLPHNLGKNRIPMSADMYEDPTMNKMFFSTDKLKSCLFESFVKE
jgi:hypothetical protein